MKERALAAEEELELTRQQSQVALEAEQERCHGEVTRVRKQASDNAAEANRRHMAQQAEISALNVSVCVKVLPLDGQAVTVTSAGANGRAVFGVINTAVGVEAKV